MGVDLIKRLLEPALPAFPPLISNITPQDFFSCWKEIKSSRAREALLVAFYSYHNSQQTQFNPAIVDCIKKIEQHRLTHPIRNKTEESCAIDNNFTEESRFILKNLIIISEFMNRIFPSISGNISQLKDEEVLSWIKAAQGLHHFAMQCFKNLKPELLPPAYSQDTKTLQEEIDYLLDHPWVGISLKNDDGIPECKKIFHMLATLPDEAYQEGDEIVSYTHILQLTVYKVLLYDGRITSPNIRDKLVLLTHDLTS